MLDDSNEAFAVVSKRCIPLLYKSRIQFSKISEIYEIPNESRFIAPTIRLKNKIGNTHAFDYNHNID